MSTTIAQWGNSSGVRIPSKVLKKSRFKVGDSVDLVVDEFGDIKIVRSKLEHRRVLAAGRMTASQLYDRYPGIRYETSNDSWPNDDMMGAEWESWSK